MTTTAMLRQATRPEHDAVDALFGAIDLADRAGYARFLHAHAAALRPVEAWLATQIDLPAWSPRAPLVDADLTALGQVPPPPLRFDPPAGAGTAWGALYVIEGSRLGNAYLARQVPAGWPATFLNARHAGGSWRALLAAINARGDAEGPAWRGAVLDGARHCFALYHDAG